MLCASPDFGPHCTELVPVLSNPALHSNWQVSPWFDLVVVQSAVPPLLIDFAFATFKVAHVISEKKRIFHFVFKLCYVQNVVTNTLS